jgi:2-phosphosulfolactate phosphatase
MRIDVSPTAEAAEPAGLEGATVLVVDVLRASTTIVAALESGCAAIVPVADADEARRRAAATPGALLAGERRGEPLAGFDLGNSPLEFTPARVKGRTVYLTTSNGTRALRAARAGAAVGVAALVNAGAAADWAAGLGRAVVVLCAGERGRPSLEDSVCAGLLAARLVGLTGAALAPEARAAVAVARQYRGALARLAADASWARHLTASGRGGDVTACLALDVSGLVPIYRADVDKVVAGPG